MKNTKMKELLQKLGTLMALAILVLIFCITMPDKFMKVGNFMNILKQASINCLIASGMLCALITAGIDLSVGSNCVLCTCTIGVMVQSGITNPFLLALCGLAVSTLAGFINGTLLTRLDLPHPFVSTMGMKNVLWGLALVITGSKSIAFTNTGIDGLMWIGGGSLFTTYYEGTTKVKFPGIPFSFILVIIVFIIFDIFLRKTALGRQIYCVGGNPEAARLSGIPSKNVLTFVYTLSGFMAGMAGIVSVGRLASANGNAGSTYDNDAIAACIVGGASFTGGKGTIWGTLIGALLMVILFYVPYGPARTSVFLYFVNSITPGNAFAPIPQNIERHIAMAHTLFNIVTVVALFPFMGWFARLCEFILPVHDEASLKTHTLEPLLLKTPSVALEQTVAEIRKMVSGSWKMIDCVVNRHFLTVNVDSEAFKELREQEQRIDDMQTAITNYLVQITRRPLTQHQSDLIPLLMHCTNDAERIADHTENIMKLTKRLAKANAELSDVAKADLARLWGLLDSQAKNVRIALAGTDKESVLSALKEEKKINKLAKRYEKDYMRNQDSFKDIEPDSGMIGGDPAEAVNEEISNRVIFMDQGVIAVEGTPDEVFDSENARMQGFLGKFREK